jgi:two-component system cell cycle response regulator
LKVSVLIVDANPTNRMALKVKLTAAWYDVAQANSGAEALAYLKNEPVDIVIASDALTDMPLSDLARAVTGACADDGTGETSRDAPPFIALTRTCSGRIELLQAGAEDVLPRPVPEEHLIARIRSVLRAHSARAEWHLRDTTSRALGFAEPIRLFDHATQAVLLQANGPHGNDDLAEDLAAEPKLSLRTVPMDRAVPALLEPGAPDIVLFPLTCASAGQTTRALTALADLRAHPAARTKAILAIVPDGAHDLAARALDLGAEDVAMARVPNLITAQDLPGEIALRASRLHIRHQMTESLRNTIRSGAEAALHDPLTGLYNRRYALPYLQRVAEQAEQTGKSFAVMVADLDHFKRINDRYGHVVGDAVLVECARRLQENMRAQDLAARIGGEEFLIVLPGTERADARKAALRLCERIAETGIEVPGLGAPVRVTISIGLAMSNTQPDLFDAGPSTMLADPDSLLERADRALYEAKQRGRNRFSLERPAA